jgi:hypothetical protein
MGISLDGGRPERTLRPRKNEKMYFLLPFDLEHTMAGGADTICCGLVGERGCHFCMKLSRHCTVQGQEHAKMFRAMDMEDKHYINNAILSQAFT